MTSTLASTYTPTATAFVGGSFGGEGGNTNHAHLNTSPPHKSSPRSSPGAKTAEGQHIVTRVRSITADSVKSQQCYQTYLRQYTYDISPPPPHQHSSSNSSGDPPSAWSRSLHSETTRPYSSAGAHSSTSATSDEEEELVHSTPRRPTYRSGRKLNLTFLQGDRSPPVQTEQHPAHNNIQLGVGSAAQSQEKLSAVQGAAVRSEEPPSQTASPNPQSIYRARSAQSDQVAQIAGRRSVHPQHMEISQSPVQYQYAMSSEPNLALHRSPMLPNQSLAPGPPTIGLSLSHPEQSSKERPEDTKHSTANDVLRAEDADAEPCSAPLSSTAPPVRHSVEQSIVSNHASKPQRKAPLPVKSREEAATVIARAWRVWKKAQELHLAALVNAIQQARHSAAVTIQRVWKGHQLRRFVYDEVCKLRILYWEPSMNLVSNKELEDDWTVKIFGAFTVPAWKSEVVMEYCRIRRMFVLYTNVPQGRYECKFIVNGKHTNCPWLHESIANPDGIENSLITVAAHPLKDWWGKRLAYLESARRSKSARVKGSTAPTARREVCAATSSQNHSL